MEKEWGKYDPEFYSMRVRGRLKEFKKQHKIN